MNALSNFDIERFLNDYWQKKPLLIKAALAGYNFPLTPDDLAGMACEPGIESRLIIGDESQGYQLTNGPLAEDTFKNLPEKNWTILVQSVDHYIPEVSQLLNYFRFIPNWRIDDVMVSYAAEGGSAAPHFDNYDVFLIQGRGQRRWKVGAKYSSDSQFQDNDDLQLLAGFIAEQEWVLDVGDILYLPPSYGHWGIGEGNECMTYSVGFRAPSQAELLADFCDEKLSLLSEELRYTDPELNARANPGEINNLAITKIQQILASQLTDRQQIAQWFGRYMTQPKNDSGNDEITSGTGDYNRSLLDTLLGIDGLIIRDPASRFAFNHLVPSNSQPTNNSLLFFVNGETFNCQNQCAALAELLAGSDSYDTNSLAKFLSDDDCTILLGSLFNQGCLYRDDEL